MTDSLQVTHDPKANKFAAVIDGRESHLDYIKSEGGPMVITHTFVHPLDRGAGVAGSLTREALGYARENDLRVVPQCGYVRSFIQKHAEYHPLLTGD